MPKTVSQKAPLILASTSPRRRELLRLMGVAFRVQKPKVSERRKRRESVTTMVKRLARTKAQSVASTLIGKDPAWILSADTVVYVLKPSRVLGKPKNRNEAKRFLRLLSGKVHEVLTAFCLLQFPSGKIFVKRVRSQVRFRTLSTLDIQSYLATGEWRDKAGAYGIQGHGAFLAESISGSYSNVVGLPIQQVLQALKKAKVLD